MKFRDITIIAATGLAALAFSAPAQSAVSVFGNGLSQTCFEAAEYGNNAMEGVASCTVALDETAMTTHDRAATMVNRGILHARLGQSSAALNDYNQGLTLDDSLGEGYVDRGATEITMRSYDAALTDISKGIDLHAQKPEIAYYDRAIVNEALGNVRDAYADYKKAVDLRPDFQLANDQLMRFRVVRKHADGA